MNCSLVALYKRATMSKTLSISFKKSDITDLLVIRANCSHKTSDSLEKTYFSYVFDSFSQFSSLYMPKSESLPSLFDQSLFLKEGRERFTLVALSLYKKVTMSKSLPLLFTNERPWAVCSHCLWQKSDWSDLLFFLSKSLFHSQKWFAQKTYEWIPNPAWHRASHGIRNFACKL